MKNLSEPGALATGERRMHGSWLAAIFQAPRCVPSWPESSGFVLECSGAKGPVVCTRRPRLSELDRGCPGEEAQFCPRLSAVDRGEWARQDPSVALWPRPSPVIPGHILGVCTLGRSRADNLRQRTMIQAINGHSK